MKITISFLPNERPEADVVLAFVRSLLAGARIRMSDRHPPFYHIYISTKQRGTNSERTKRK